MWVVALGFKIYGIKVAILFWGKEGNGMEVEKVG